MSEKKKKYLQFVLNLFLVAVGFIVFLYFGWKLLMFFMPFVIGWLIALIANPLVRFLEKRLKIIRKHGSMLIIIAVLAGIIGLGYAVVNQVVIQGENLISRAPEIYDSFSKDFKTVGGNLDGIYKRLPVEAQEMVSDMKATVAEKSSEWIQSLSTPTVSAAGRFVKYLPTLFILIIFTIISAYFFVAERDRILEWCRAHVPQVVQEKWKLVTGSFGQAFGGYFKAQLKIMVVVYVILLVGLLILGVDFAALIAFLIAFLDMLPFFGTGTALIPWAVFEFLAGDTRMAIALLVIYAVSQIVHQVIQPKMVGDSVGINPLFALIIMFIGYRFSGVLGMIIAIPIGILLLNFYKSGIFDDLIGGFKMVASDLYHFMKD